MTTKDFEGAEVSCRIGSHVKSQMCTWEKNRPDYRVLNTSLGRSLKG